MYYASTCMDHEIVEKKYKLGLNVTDNYKVRYNISLISQIFEGRCDYKNVVRLSLPKSLDLYKTGSNHYAYTLKVNMINVEKIYKLDNFEDVKELIDLGADINEAIKNIIIVNNIDSLKYLLEKGANIDLINSYLAKMGNIDIFKFLFVKKCPMNKFLPIAVECGHFNLVKFLVEKGVYVDFIDRTKYTFSEYTPLVAACSAGHIKIVEYLIEKGANYKNSYGVYLAAEKGHYDVVKFLIDKGTDLKKYGLRSLNEVIKKGHFDIMKLFINSGLEIDYDYYIYKAGLRGHTDIVKYLVMMQMSKQIQKI